jgi:predicted ATP-binding protein involved in virulence
MGRDNFMWQIFIKKLKIENVRHLHDIDIPLSENEKKHLILTGKNGSGKTSVIDAMAKYLNCIYTAKSFPTRFESINGNNQQCGLNVELNVEDKDVWALKDKYHFIIAYYRADRVFEAERPKHVEKVDLKDEYGIEEFPRHEFIKYLLDLKVTESLARNNNKIEKAEEIHNWFDKFESLLKQIFDDQSLSLIFDEETFEFHISQNGRELFDFNTLSSGYQAVLDIVLDLIMRMGNQTHRTFNFDIAGIVLIDEIDAHLHLEMQKNIMPLLTTIFPNVQFVVTTHSPFILNSIDNAVIYDLENRTLVENGLQDIPYDGIVEGYFGAKTLSNTLNKKFERYKELSKKDNWSDDEVYELQQLELYLDEIPDYLALNITTEYQRLKLQIDERMEING